MVSDKDTFAAMAARLMGKVPPPAAAPVVAQNAMPSATTTATPRTMPGSGPGTNKMETSTDSYHQTSSVRTSEFSFSAAPVPGSLPEHSMPFMSTKPHTAKTPSATEQKTPAVAKSDASKASVGFGTPEQLAVARELRSANQLDSRGGRKPARGLPSYGLASTRQTAVPSPPHLFRPAPPKVERSDSRPSMWKSPSLWTGQPVDSSKIDIHKAPSSISSLSLSEVNERLPSQSKARQAIPVSPLPEDKDPAYSFKPRFGQKEISVGPNPASLPMKPTVTPFSMPATSPTLPMKPVVDPVSVPEASYPFAARGLLHPLASIENRLQKEALAKKALTEEASSKGAFDKETIAKTPSSPEQTKKSLVEPLMQNVNKTTTPDNQRVSSGTLTELAKHSESSPVKVEDKGTKSGDVFKKRVTHTTGKQRGDLTHSEKIADAKAGVDTLATEMSNLRTSVQPTDNSTSSIETKMKGENTKSGDKASDVRPGFIPMEALKGGSPLNKVDNRLSDVEQRLHVVEAICVQQALQLEEQAKQLQHMTELEEKRKLMGAGEASAPFMVNVKCPDEVTRIQAHKGLKISDFIRRVRIATGVTSAESPNPSLTVNDIQVGHAMTVGEAGMTESSTMNFTHDKPSSAQNLT